MKLPTIIQGGMGVGVSNWNLAKTVSKMGQLGVVSGTALDSVFARRLQHGDPGGHIKRALDHFPVSEIAQRVYDKYFIPCGKAIDQAFKRIPMQSLTPNRLLQEITICANFVEVFLAKEGHDGKVGINYLEKIQMPNLASIYGAMLAGVDYILMGAGIPREIPGVLDKYVNHEAAELKVKIDNSDESVCMRFDPQAIVGKLSESLHRPNFLAIISSATLAITLAKKSTGKVNGFVVEGYDAGGHNAPPRGQLKIDDNGEPIYGEKDEIDLQKIGNLGLPFWLAGSYGSPERIQEALDDGAAGVQLGTPFAFCRESGIEEHVRQQVVEKILNDEVDVLTDAKASPTGFPFKVVQTEGTLSNNELYQQRPRICDLGYLRTPFKSEAGEIGYRCPSEPVEDYVRKEGDPEATKGRKCLCNGLFANIGQSQVQRTGYVEKPLLTSGKDLSVIKQFIKDGETSYSAVDVIRALCPQPQLEPAIA
ncbi:MAG: nitronate monooxygenase [Candidatus Hinthialibacter antarcticus]|nr:nitronate monooxygenase [Candidatus Hinthialibacter antarcticus]